MKLVEHNINNSSENRVKKINKYKILIISLVEKILMMISHIYPDSDPIYQDVNGDQAEYLLTTYPDFYNSLIMSSGSKKISRENQKKISQCHLNKKYLEHNLNLNPLYAYASQSEYIASKVSEIRSKIAEYDSLIQSLNK